MSRNQAKCYGGCGRTKRQKSQQCGGIPNDFAKTSTEMALEGGTGYYRLSGQKCEGKVLQRKEQEQGSEAVNLGSWS